MVIDSHQHLGRSLFSGVETTQEALVQAMARHGIGAAVVMPQPTREPAGPLHDRIAAAAAVHPGRLFGAASIDPWLADAAYREEARRCVERLGFVALKLHPLGHNLPPDHREAAKVFRAAEELGVPVIVHTGLGSPWALPSLCIPAARRHRRLPIVLAHAGWGVYSREAVVAADTCENIVLEPSWCPTFAVQEMVRRFGAERVMFGSDHVSNIPVELAKYEALELAASERAAVLGGTARRVFRLEGRLAAHPSWPKS